MNARDVCSSSLDFDLSQVDLHSIKEKLDLQTSFYDLILGHASPDALEGPRNSEQRVLDRLKQVLSSSTELADMIPALPKPVLELIDALQNDSTDFEYMAQLIGQDVKLSIEIIRLANSPLFRHAEQKIDSIEQAIQSLGFNNIAMVATEVALKGVLKIDSLYFKWFGELVWDHARQCAAACRYLSDKSSALNAHLAGVVYDTGKIIIYKCLVSIVKELQTDELPQSDWFKLSMTQHAKGLSVLAAKEWQLPEEVVLALEEQESIPRSPLSVILSMSDMFSELNLLIRDSGINKKDVLEILNEGGVSSALAEELFSEMNRSTAEQGA